MRRSTIVFLLAPLAALSLLANALAASHARSVRWGSTLQAAPERVIPGNYDADAEFWAESFSGGSARGVRPTATAPINGRILSVKLKTGDDAFPVSIRFSVIEPRPGGVRRVLTTSTPAFTLPAHSPGIHTFDFSTLRFRMPINKGDLLSIDTPGAKPAAMVWYGAVPGALSDSFTSRGATQNPGFDWHGSPHSGTELLMQVLEAPGPRYPFHCRC